MTVSVKTQLVRTSMHIEKNENHIFTHATKKKNTPGHCLEKEDSNQLKLYTLSYSAAHEEFKNLFCSPNGMRVRANTIPWLIC